MHAAARKEFSQQLSRLRRMSLREGGPIHQIAPQFLLQALRVKLHEGETIEQSQFGLHLGPLVLAFLTERWRIHDNTIRPHSSLGGQPPVPETVRLAS